MDRFGHALRLTIWGESHGPEVGVALDGVPPGIALAEADFETDLARRRSGAAGTTSRSEKDCPRIVSGLYEGRTTGAPLAIVFDNRDMRPADYTPLTHHFRPSHADWVARERSGGWNDPRGGGHFSGRLTVGIVAAGVVAKRILGKGIRFTTRLTEVGGCTEESLFGEVVRTAAAEGDSVGGIVECRIEGCPAGWGDPMFDAAESTIAHLLFAIPGVRGVEFGSGFAAARMRGSEHNDPILSADGRTATNHAGGIVGGLTNGNPIVVRTAFKPTASIAREQMTYDAATGRIAPLVIHGRHDASIAVRGAVVIEAAAAIALADLKCR